MGGSAPHGRSDRVADVSRETWVGLAPPPPPAAVAAFGAALPLARRYADLLAGPGVERGLLGPREVPRLWERHLANCAGLADIAETALTAAPDPEAGRDGPIVVDLGSGAGLPGVVLALLRPRWQVVLLEPLLRRSVFLAEVVEVLDLTSASVVRARAEDYARTVGPAADLVVARAVAPLDRLVRWALPLTRGGGSLLAVKGATAAAELQAARAAVRAAGGVDSEVIAVPESPSRVVRVVHAAAPPTRSRSTRRAVPDRRGRP